MKRSDLKDQKFGRLIVIEFHGKDKFGGTLWYCQCDCGNNKVVQTQNLKNGKVKSCGCLRSECIGNRRRTHGLSGSHFWKSWIAMRNRCNSSDPRIAKYYKDRGIVVCDSWENFENFKNDMYESYNEHFLINGRRQTTLDRIDNNLSYNKNNCRWATTSTQANNHRPQFSLNSYENINEFLNELSEIIGTPIPIISETLYNQICEKIRI